MMPTPSPLPPPTPARRRGLRRRLAPRVVGVGMALMLAGLGMPAPAHTVTDMAGRTIAMPAPARRVFAGVTALGPTLAALAPDLMVAFPYPLADGALDFLPAPLASLPTVTVLDGLDAERVLALRPDLVLGWNGNAAMRARTGGVAERIGVPVLFYEGERLAQYPAVLRALGAALDRRQRAETLARALEDSQAKLAAALAGLRPEQRPRVYYAESPDGLTTQCGDSTRLEVITLAGGTPALQCRSAGFGSSQAIDFESLLALDPDVILTRDRGIAEHLRTEPRWRMLRAVRAGHVHAVPALPFNWFDRPPSFMRALGAQWLARLLHPARFTTGIAEEARRFNQLFFGIAPPPGALERLLAD